MAFIAKDIDEACTIREELDAQFKAGDLIVMNGWLVGRVDSCTCSGGYPYGHEPSCGFEPYVDLVTIEEPK